MASKKSQKPGDQASRFRYGGKLLSGVVENLAAPTFVVATDGALVHANQAFADLLGYAPSECVGLGIDAIVHVDDAASARAQNESLMRGKATARRAERRYLRKDGEAIWVLESISPLRGDGSPPRAFIVQAVDIDRQQRAEAALRMLTGGKSVEWSPDGELSKIIGADIDLASLKNADGNLS
jgi:diguanylate cyclase